ncbi:uncharacterized protein LOC135481941 [Liolophura sinensis]|uniref:uncharacterized protein LOC135481941 n=1 Tax=Liolophura sinensis TaxID=3198878 RepID=UPI003158CCC1
MASGSDEQLSDPGVRERTTGHSDEQSRSMGQSPVGNQNLDSTGNHLAKCDRMVSSVAKVAKETIQLWDDCRQKMIGPANNDIVPEAVCKINKPEAEYPCKANKMHSLKSVKPHDEVYPSIDPDGLKVQSSESFHATQYAFDKFYSLLYSKHIQLNPHAPQHPSIFAQLQPARTYEGLKIQDGQLETCRMQSAEENSELGIRKTAVMGPDDSNTCTSTGGTRDSVHSWNSGSASDRRSKYQSSTEMRQEEGYSDSDVFDEGQPDIPYRRQVSDTGSLPDVILSTSSTAEMSEMSPDLLQPDPACHQSLARSLSDNSCNVAVADMPLPSAGASTCTSKEKKLEMEGRVHDPKGKLKRQVSFSTEISICENGSNRMTSTSAEDKRNRYSHKTSGYGTGESSKNSTENGSTEDNTYTEVFSLEDDQNGSETTGTSCSQMGSETNLPELSILEITSGTNTGTCPFTANCVQTSVHVCAEEATGSPSKDQGECIHNLQGEAALANQNQPNLSILMRKVPDNSNTLNSFKDSQKHPPATDTSLSCSQQAGCLPNLSILSRNGSSLMVSTSERNDSSLMVSPSELPSEEKLSGEREETVPPEVQDCLTSTASGETNRTAESDSYALETLKNFQKLTAVQKLHNSQFSLDKTRRYSDRHVNKPLTDKAFVQKARDDLIANYFEDLLLLLTPDSREFEQTIQWIQHLLAPESSPSPVTPLTPQIRKARGAASPDQKRKNFYFQEQQSVDLQQREKKLQEMLVRSSRCDYYLCSDHNCRQGKRLLQDLEKALLTQLSDKTYTDYFSELLCLFDHSQHCDEIKCPVPWCNFLSWKYSSERYTEIDLKEVTKKLTEFVLHPTLKFTSMSTNEETFFALSSQFSACPVVEGRDWIALLRIGKFGGSVLARETQTQKDWVVKRVQLTHPEADNRLQVYRRLNNHAADHIVTYLWMKQTGKVLFVCTEYEPGGSLFDHILTTGPFEARQALHFFSQVLSAASFLHNLKILFLYWNAKNVVLTNRYVAKLCNFSTAVHYNDSYDLEELSNLVPATLLPPELLNGQVDVSLCPKQDSWGLGCLLKELVTGLSSRQELIHEDRTETESQIKDSPLPIVPALIDSTVQEILQGCWKVIPEERMSASQLSELLTHALA